MTDSVNVPGAASHAKVIQTPVRMAHANVVQMQHAAEQQIHARLVSVNAVQDKHVQDRRPNAVMEHVFAILTQTTTQRLQVPAHLRVHIHTIPQ